MYKFIILGAGPAGLTFANKLLQSGEMNFLVIEKENCAGGALPERVSGWRSHARKIYRVDIMEAWEKIADDYMISYNCKIFGGDLDNLGTYWLDKLPNVPFDETLISCFEKNIWKTTGICDIFLSKKVWIWGIVGTHG